MINKDLLMGFFKDDDIKVVDKDFYIKSQMKSDVIKYITILEEENEELKQDNIIGCKKFIKQRQIIDKAIEWVKEHIETYQKNEIVILDWDNFSDPRKLLKILGGDEE